MSGFPAIVMMLLSFALPVGMMLLVLKGLPQPAWPIVAAAILIGAALFPLGLLAVNHTATTVAWVTFGGGIVLGWLTYSIRRVA